MKTYLFSIRNKQRASSSSTSSSLGSISKNAHQGTLRARPDLSMLPHRNSVAFCSTRGVGSNKSASILANGLHAVIHQLFAAAGGKIPSLVARAASVFVSHVLAGEESEGKDVDGKRSCTEGGLCTVIG